jgi:hypothetical protein
MFCVLARKKVVELEFVRLRDRLSRAGAQRIVVFKTSSDGRHFRPPLQRTNYNVLRAFLLAEYWPSA